MRQHRSLFQPWRKPPRNARLVFKGRVYSIYQWPQRLFDGRTVTYEAVWRPASVNIIATVGKRFLVTRERQPGIRGWYWGLPGGRAQDGETPLQGAKRELLEETGCVSRDWKLLGTERAWAVTRWMSCWYLARNCRKIADQSTHPGGEVVRVFEVGLEELLTRTLSWTGSILTDFAEMKHDRKMRDAFAKEVFGPAPGD